MIMSFYDNREPRKANDLEMPESSGASMVPSGGPQLSGSADYNSEVTIVS